VAEQKCEGFAEEYTTETPDRLLDSDDAVCIADDEDSSECNAKPSPEHPAASGSDYKVSPEKKTKVIMS
jgi:hypothetical protein